MVKLISGFVSLFHQGKVGYVMLSLRFGVMARASAILFWLKQQWHLALQSSKRFKQQPQHSKQLQHSKQPQYSKQLQAKQALLHFY